MNFWFLTVATLLSTVNKVAAYPGFDRTIPNGENVQHPCVPGKTWSALGHKAFLGGGERNPFGEDFAKAEYRWTKELCMTDSDGDGRTNGEELGDPLCTWQKDSHPERSIGLSHPGICEPVDSELCRAQKDWISCSSSKFQCAATEHPHVRAHDVLFPRTQIPRQNNTYMCVIVELPNDQDYHIVAHEPVINNVFATHHMVLTGCSRKMTTKLEPFTCQRGSKECEDVLAVWSLGSKGTCCPVESGVRFGNSSYKYAQLKIHWANYDLKSDWYDSSGMRLFYSSKLRQYDMGIFETGQVLLKIPPGQRKVISTGLCTQNCSKEILTNEVNITEVFPHAHYLAKRVEVEQYRDKARLRQLMGDRLEYGNPSFKVHNPPVSFAPGDEIRTTCEFDSRTLTGKSVYGEGTLDDSCLAYISYYPKMQRPENQKLCKSFGRYSMCAVENGSIDYYQDNFGDCNFTDLHPKRAKVMQYCGHDAERCSSACNDHVQSLYSHPCMKGYIRWTAIKLINNGTGVSSIDFTKLKLVCDKTNDAGRSCRSNWFLFVVSFVIGQFAFSI